MRPTPRRQRRPTRQSSAVPTLLFQLQVDGLPAPVLEYRFHPTRKWPFDLAWPAERLAVEVEGGLFINGRHSRGEGYERDLVKYAEALLAGWRVLRVSPRQVKNGQAVGWITRALEARQGDENAAVHD